MTEPDTSAAGQSFEVFSKILGCGIVLLFLVCTGLIIPIVQMGWILASGWFFFLQRTTSEITVNAGSIRWFFVALLLLMLFGHWTAVWLTRAFQDIASAESAVPNVFRWPLRRSILLIATILSCFTAGVCLVGMAHEFVWIATSKEPLTEIGGPRLAARRSQSKSNLKQLGLAFWNFHDDKATQGFPESITHSDQGELRHGWATALLPYIDQVPLYEKIRLKLVWSAAENRPVFQQKISQYSNPAISKLEDEKGYAMIHYAGNSLVLQPGRKRPIKEITDGTSNTILAGEVNANFKPWGKPGNCRNPQLGINKSPNGFGSPFLGGAQFLLADGSVRFVSENIDPKVLNALATPQGGEIVGDF
jgi:hypothetical protein